MRALKVTTGFGDVFNIATGSRISLNDLVAQLNAILGSAFVPKYLPAKQGDIKDSYADITKARTILRFEPVVPFEEGLKKTAERL